MLIKFVNTRWASLLLLVSVAGCGMSGPGAPRGQALFDNCVPCHGADAAGNPQIQAPSIAGLPQWYIEAQLRNFQSGLRGAHAEDIPGLRMRPMAVTLNTPGDISTVAQFVAALPPVVSEGVLLRGNAGAGAAIYGGICIACHGPEAGGDETLGAPPLLGADDWYLFSQLKNFRAGARGADLNDPYGLTMRVNTIPLSDETMVDVLAYIRTLR